MYAIGISLVAQMVKCLPTMQESQVRSLGQEEPLEKEMTTHSSTLAWKIYAIKYLFPVEIFIHFTSGIP